MQRKISIIITIALLAAILAPAPAANAAAAAAAAAAGKPEIDAAVNSASKYILETVKNPQVDSIGGEWVIIGLARSMYNVPDSYFDNYYTTVENYIKNCNGILHDKKYSEYSRVILGLTAAGYDPRDVAGYDLTAPLEDYENTVWQGLNGPIYALLSLDSKDYPNNQRDNYIAEILRRQLSDGGWNLTGGISDETKNQTSDPDVTGMALQALAKYQSKPEIRNATEKALDRLSKMQGADGGYTSWGSENIENATQVLIALCELGLPIDDARFVKNGKTLVDVILSYMNEDGSFKHIGDDSVKNQMSAEQALCGLVAAQRALEGKNSLYRMSDAQSREGNSPTETGGLPGKHADVTKVPILFPGKTFTDIKNHQNQASIEALAERGIINGKSETNFDPEATMTRAEFAAIVTRGLGLNNKAQITDEDHFFTDVTKNDWFCEAVYTAAHYGIVKGVSDTQFNPKGTITKQEAAVMTARAAELCGMDTNLSDTATRDILAQFDDYRTVATWAQAPTAFCYHANILDNNTQEINPKETIKRHEVAKIIHQLTKYT